MVKAARKQSSDNARPVPRRDWKGTLTAATDIALIGFFMVGASLLIVTIGAAAATGSYAIRHWTQEETTPPISELWRQFLRWILPGALALGLITGILTLLVINLNLISQKHVPGGLPMSVVTVILIVCLASITLLTLIHLGRWPEGGWFEAVKWSVGILIFAPHRVIALLLICVVAAILSYLVPPTFPVLVAYGLFGAHVGADRLLPEENPNNQL